METTELPINETELTTIRLAVEDAHDNCNEDMIQARVELLELHAKRLLEVVDAFMMTAGGNLANDVRQVLKERVLTERDGKAVMRGNAYCSSLSTFQARDPHSGEMRVGVDIRIMVGAI